MENEANLITQDPLSLAIQEGQEVKRLKLEEERRALELRKQEYLKEMDIEINTLVINFLVNKFGILRYRVTDILRNKKSKLKVYKATLKSLILRKAAWYSITLGFIGLMRCFIWLMLNNEVSPGTQIFGRLSGISGIIGTIWGYCVFEGKIYKKVLGDKHIKLVYFLKLIKRLRQNIITMETEQKLIG